MTPPLVAACGCDADARARSLRNSARAERRRLESFERSRNRPSSPPRIRDRRASSSRPASSVDAKTFPDCGIDLRAAVEEYENGLIRQALEKTSRNKNRAAQLLGINRRTLVEMVKRKGL